MSYHTVAVLCNIMPCVCVCVLPRSYQSWIAKGNHIPKDPLIFMLDMVKKMHIPDYLIGFPTLSENSQNKC